MNTLKKAGFLFAVGCGGYCLIELLHRGYTHWTMGVTGGLCCIGLHGINTRMARRSVWLRCLTGAAFITAAEFLVGCLVNLKLGWSVWDYSRRAMNFKGQICAAASSFWFLLCIPVMSLGRRVTRRMKLFSGS